MAEPTALMTERRAPRPDYGYASCGYGCGYRATFYVAHDNDGSYTCTRHLAHYVRHYQTEVPTRWLQVCELTR